jgi:protein O-mannosyl-transferase
VRRQLQRSGAPAGATVLVALAPGRAGASHPAMVLERRPWRRTLLAAALVTCVAGLVGIATEVVLIRRGAPSWVRTWPLSAGVIVVGLGLLVEGWRSPPTPWRFRVTRPLAYSGPLWLSFGALWLVVSYFPHSNIPQLLPTVRAERFWYFPVIGTSLLIGHVLSSLLARGRAAPRPSLDAAGLTAADASSSALLASPDVDTAPRERAELVASLEQRSRWSRWTDERAAGTLVVVAFLGFQFVQTYRHAMDYRDDLVFWAATKDAVPRSAKAHLNYSVMKGARSDLETRLVHSRIAAELAPQWPMAHIYTGDTLCRLHRPDEAWPHYVRGFELGPNERALIALAMQCLWDEGRVKTYETQLEELSAKNEGSWLAWLARDTVANGEKNQGVDPKYRPRGYNEGPKQE